MKIWTKIKNVFDKVGKWLSGATEVTDAKISKYAPIAVDVINAIKNFNDSGTMDVIEDVSATVLGKYGTSFKGVMTLIRMWIKSKFPQIVEGLNIAIAVASKSDIKDKLIAARQAILDLGIDKKSYAYSELAAQLVVYLEDGKIDIKEALEMVKVVYTKYLNKVTQ